ncbi:hypothetical protein Dimus_032868 [Dionaea muscipula]
MASVAQYNHKLLLLLGLVLVAEIHTRSVATALPSTTKMGNLSALLLLATPPAQAPTTTTPFAAGSPRADQPGRSGHGISITVQIIRRMMRKQHRKGSAAGGDVILGGFAVAIAASVFCYIRVTRNRKKQESKPTIVTDVGGR